MMRSAWILLTVLYQLSFLDLVKSLLTQKISPRINNNYRTHVDSNSKSVQSLKMAMTSEEYKNSLWSDRVQYVDLLAREEEPTPNTCSLPLFLLSGAFYPSGTSYIHVFEMKYRTMMFDCANSDELFGYIHTDSRTGSIASYGTMCKIVDRQLLEDGRQFIAFEGVGRFRVRKILKTLPYVLGEVEANIHDITPLELQEKAEALEKQTYSGLKSYIRLVRALEPNRTFRISQAAKKARPCPQNELKALTAESYAISESERRTSFTFAVANMIQMNQDKESQLILQTTDCIKRMTAQNDILLQAVDLVSAELLKKGEVNQEQIDAIKAMSFSNADKDDDVLPPDVMDVKADEVKDEWDISNIE